MFGEIEMKTLSRKKGATKTLLDFPALIEKLKQNDQQHSKHGERRAAQS